MQTMKFYKTKTFQYIGVLIFIMVSYQFCNYVGFSNTLKKLPQMLSVPLMFAVCWKPLFMIKNSNSLFRTMRWIIISLMVSIFSAWIFWNQSLMLGFRSSSTMFVILFFFYLYKIRPDVSFLENIIWIMGITYIVLWLYAFSQIPFPVFSAGDEETGLLNEDMSRGMIRINLRGIIFLVMAFFLSLNKFYTTRRKMFLIVAGIFFLFIIFQLTRQLILWTALVGMVYVYLKNPKKIFGVCLAVFFLFSLFINVEISDDSLIGSMMNLTKEQMQSNTSKGDENIRITEYKYFFCEWSKNIITTIIGNGMPHSSSQYGQMYNELTEQKRLFLSDVGYAEMFVVLGLWGLFLYLFLFFKSIRFQMPADLDYARMFMLFLIPANIAADWYAKPDGQIALCICVYLIMQYGCKSKRKILATSNSTYHNWVKNH